jgi:hypothetical protein
LASLLAKEERKGVKENLGCLFPIAIGIKTEKWVGAG